MLKQIEENEILNPEEKEEKVVSTSPIQLDTPLMEQYRQLEMDFNDNFTVFSFGSQVALNNLDKVYVNRDSVHYPFMLGSNTEDVRISRKGYYVKQKVDKLKKEKASKQEIAKAGKYETSPNDTTKTFYFDNTYEKHEWTIIAHQHWGFPDDLDFYVWDIVKQLWSESYQKTGKISQIYIFRIRDILNELVNRKYYKAIGGKQAQNVKDSIYRLKNTSYQHKIQKTKRDTGENIIEPSKEFSLIAAIYWQGEILENGSPCPNNHVAIAINPSILIELTKQKYVISDNTKRKNLFITRTISLHDKFSNIVHINLKNKTFLKYRACKIKPFSIQNYHALCNFLGIKPLTGNLKKSKIETQLEKEHKELIDNKVVESFLVYKSKNDKRPFNIIYVFHDEFIQNVVSLRKGKKDYIIEVENTEISSDDRNNVWKQVNSLIKDDGAKELVRLESAKT
jgi:hypothetical protein